MVKFIITGILSDIGVDTLNEVVEVLKKFEQEAFQEEQEAIEAKNEKQKKYVSDEEFFNLIKDIDFGEEVDWSESSFTANSTTVENTDMQKALEEKPVIQTSPEICTVSTTSIPTSEGFNVQVSFFQ